MLKKGRFIAEILDSPFRQITFSDLINTFDSEMARATDQGDDPEIVVASNTEDEKDESVIGEDSTSTSSEEGKDDVSPSLETTKRKSRCSNCKWAIVIAMVGVVVALCGYGFSAPSPARKSSVHAHTLESAEKKERWCLALVNLTLNASNAEIKTAFHKQMLIKHPDVCLLSIPLCFKFSDQTCLISHRKTRESVMLNKSS